MGIPAVAFAIENRMLAALPIIDYATHPDYAHLPIEPDKATRAALEYFP